MSSPFWHIFEQEGTSEQVTFKWQQKVLKERLPWMDRLFDGPLQSGAKILGV
jgi:hypothetical protein